MWRALRHWLTARATDAAMAAAPRLRRPAADRLQRLVGRLGPHLPVVARMVADNMRALGLYTPATHRAYFAQLAAHFAGALHTFRQAGCENSPELRRIVTEQIELDDSVATLADSLRGGHGAVIMGPHITNFLLNLPRLGHAIPLTVYMRYSRDTRRRLAKLRWCRSNGLDWIAEPAPIGKPPERLKTMAAAIERGRAIFITPDMPRKRGDGTPVRFFNREIYFPAGAAVLAVRTGAPLFMLLAEQHGPRQRLVIRGPSEIDVGDTGHDGKRAAVQRHLQWFTDRFERFLTQQTPLWYSWGDKRWTQVLRGDPRYVGALTASSVQPSSAATPVAGAI